ncbi:hypothetical protein MK489_19660 [Myxococcota bacterium]|nr:hypothetical protein [Myxococcota bacterium]
MGKIRFFDPSEAEFRRSSELTPAGGNVGEAERMGTAVRFHHMGTEDEPQLFEVDLDPDLVVPSHAHSKDEIIVILDGEIRMGKRVFGPGSSLLVPGETFYGFTVGPRGCRFLNFRPMADGAYQTYDDYLKQQRSSS